MNIVEDTSVTYVIFYGDEMGEKTLIVSADSYSTVERFARNLIKKTNEDESAYWFIEIFDSTNEAFVDLLDKQENRIYELKGDI